MRLEWLYRRAVRTAVLATLLAAVQTPLLRADLAAVERGRRQLLNQREIGDEAAVAAGTEAAVKDYFFSFRDYQDLMLFHPKFGYYSSGFVSFVGDWTTYPVVLRPYFGQMIAEQIFRMWDGMRRAGTLAAEEPFTIAEFGAGDGSLAESILDYVDGQSKTASDKRWLAFAGQAVYACYDRSPALSEAQRQRNARFGKRFEARVGDAAEPTATIAPGSLKGVVLSNEMLDNFSVHKVILSPGGSAEVAFVAPWLAAEVWRDIGERVPADVKKLVAADNQAIQTKFSPGVSGSKIYLSRAAFIAILEWLAASPDFPAKAGAIGFSEIYVPAATVPELAEHLRRYARPYAYELAKGGKGFVSYIGLGWATFIQGAGRILKAGYVITIDYGANWDGLTISAAHPQRHHRGCEFQFSDARRPACGTKAGLLRVPAGAAIRDAHLAECPAAQPAAHACQGKGIQELGCLFPDSALLQTAGSTEGKHGRVFRLPGPRSPAATGGRARFRTATKVMPRANAAVKAKSLAPPIER